MKPTTSAYVDVDRYSDDSATVLRLSSSESGFKGGGAGGVGCCASPGTVRKAAIVRESRDRDMGQL
jgi:hypothetical protein